jgi:diaminohydroxyphosphoribosylaminopyrimidine deaminase / 5-amino-6-(5-phosphoribosylamino)uracil reductase
MSEALALAVSDDAPRGVNPRVGCVLVRDSRVIGHGYHRGAGSAHAEVAALSAATESPRGATAVVTLEPCAHVGRTGPCAEALIEAGISRVVFAQPDPTPQAAGGAERLREAGIEVVAGVLLEQAVSVNADWVFMKAHGRPHVTLKLAGSLDGRVDSAGADRLILTGAIAQEQVQRLRARVDAIAVGTGTIVADDPRLTVRGLDAPASPLRVVLGSSPVAADARVLADDAEVMLITRRDPRSALTLLADRGIQTLLLEGGPMVAAAYLEAGVVDEVHWYVSPLLVGEGPMALNGLGVQMGLDVTSVDVVGEDVRIIGIPAARG